MKNIKLLLKIVDRADMYQRGTIGRVTFLVMLNRVLEEARQQGLLKDEGGNN